MDCIVGLCMSIEPLTTLVYCKCMRNIHQFKTKIITYDILFREFHFSAFYSQENTLNTEKDVSAIFCHALVIRSLRKILVNNTSGVLSPISSDICRHATENTILFVLEILV